MGFFKRKKAVEAPTPTATKTPTPKSGKNPTQNWGDQDPFFGDDELKSACAALEQGSWQAASAILDTREENGWVYKKINQATSLETATAWVAAEPSARSLSALGGAQILAAWDVRGNGLGHTVGVSSAMTFHKLLLKAEATLNTAIDADDRLASPWVQLITVGMGLQMPIEERKRFFEEAHQRSPFHSGAVFAASQSLSEKWGGDEHESLEFARRIEQEAPEGHPARIAVPLAIHECAVVAGLKAMNGGGKFLGAYNDYVSQEDIVREANQSLVRLIGAVPEVAPAPLVEALNAHMYVADPLDRNVPEARLRLLKAIDNRSSPYPWSNREQFVARQQRIIWYARAIADYPGASDVDLMALYMVKHNIPIPKAA